MNIVDAVLAAVLCVFAVRGYIKGLFREVFALLGLAGGFILSVRYYEPVSLWIDFWPYSPLLLKGFVFAILFFLVYIAFNWVGFRLHRAANVFFLGGFDRFGGVLVGGSKGALFLGIGLFFLVSQSWVPRDFQQQFGTAALVAPLLGFGAWAVTKGPGLAWPGASGTDSMPGDPQRGA